MEERLVLCEKPITDTIPKNKLTLFGSAPQKVKNKNQHTISSLKASCSLFSRLYIACQSRRGNLEEFFAHENQACPPSLSDMGKMRHSAKSDLLSSLQATKPAPVVAGDKPEVDAEILDGAAVIHMLPAKGQTNFKQYAEAVFIPYIYQRLNHVDRVDIVWDRYVEDSLKKLPGKAGDTVNAGKFQKLPPSLEIGSHFLKLMPISRTSLISLPFR